jgi:hypothetical protein
MFSREASLRDRRPEPPEWRDLRWRVSIDRIYGVGPWQKKR